MMHFKEGEKVRMVWKTFFCGGDLRGVVTNVSPSDKKIIVKMRNGDYVVHDTTRTEFCKIVREENWPAYCVELGLMTKRQGTK
jgi:hypothetical protein